MTQNDEFEKFLSTITSVEKQREFDRRVDRLKKSSSATTFWAVFPGLFGIHGIAHFYLNRPLEGLIILVTGLIPGIFIGLYSLIPFVAPWGFLPSTNTFGFSPDYIYWIVISSLVIRVGFFIGNIISARYQYSRYESYIHYKAKKPWNNWGLDSQI